MDDSKQKELLATFPGAKKAAQGVLVPVQEGIDFHVLNIHSQKDLEGLTPEEAFFFDFCSRSEIERLRELRGAHDYLLRMRANAIVDSPRAIRVMISRRNEYEKSGRKWKLSHYYHSKDAYHKSYINSLRRPQLKSLKSIPSGLAFIPDVNAISIRSLAGDVVVASESLEYFYYFMNIAFYGQDYDIPIKDCIDALLIAVRIINGSEAMDFDIDTRGVLPTSTEREIKSLVNSQMQFTFGHEYAHLLGGHLSHPYENDEGVSSPTDREIRAYNHELEYQADFFAIKNVENAKMLHKNVLQGAFSALLYLYFVEQFQERLAIRKFSISNTHPSALDRLQNLNTKLGTKSPINDRKLIVLLKNAEKMVSILESRVETAEREDLLSFYGSVYLPTYYSKMRKDRIDF